MRPSEWRVVRWMGLGLEEEEERERERWVRCGEGERCRVRSLRAWRVSGGGDGEGAGDEEEGGGWMVMRRRERRRTRAGRLPRERPRRGGQDVRGDGLFGERVEGWLVGSGGEEGGVVLELVEVLLGSG